MSSPGQSLVSLGDLDPQRSFSRRLFGYILREFAVYLCVLIVGFLLFTTVFHLMDDLADFESETIHFSEIITYFLCLLPDKINYILPMSLLLATMKTVTGMCKHNEMSALRAMGISIFQSFTPFLLVGATMSFVLLASNELLAPDANRKSERILFLAKNPHLADATAAKDKYQFLAFRNIRGRRDWLMRTMAADGTCTEVFIQQFDDKGQVLWELRAERGSYDKIGNKWMFYDAHLTRFPKNESWPIELPFEKILDSMDEIDERPQSINFFSRLKAVDDISAKRLWEVLRDPGVDIPPTTRNILWSSFWFRLFFPFSCAISVLLGVPLAVTTQRTGAMKNFIIAVGMMVSFYLVAQTSVMLGAHTWMPPIVAGGLPVLVYIGVGIREMYKKL